MPVPENTPRLTLGRPVFDKRQFRPDTDPAIISTLERLAQALSGAGWPAAAKSGDTTYQQLYGRFVTDEWFIYAGRPDDPTNPDLVTPTTSGSTTVLVEDDGVLVGAFGTLNFKDNLTAVDAGGGVCDIDGTGGGGGGTVTEAFKTIQVSGSSDIVADLAADTLIVVAGTYMDVTTDAGTDTLTFSVDLTEVSSYNGSSDQYLRNNAGTFQWDTLPADQDTTYTGGAGIVVDGDEKIHVDPYIVSHLDFVDDTGAPSATDISQLAIKWNDIANYGVDGDPMILGHYTTDSWPPGVSYQTVSNWLKTLPDYSNTVPMVIVSDGEEDGDEIRWATIHEALKLLQGYDEEADQSIGHDISNDPLWQNDTNGCPEE